MWFGSAFASGKSGLSRSPRPRPRPTRRRLTFESLERRLALSLTTLASFNGTNGADPYGGVIMDSSGNLCGTTVAGGASGKGSVFELAHGSGAITKLASFNGTDGTNPEGALIMDSSGNLYGTTYAGGAAGVGTVFELAHGSGTITTLASFNGTNGGEPGGGVIMDGSGDLYGTTYVGGASGYGTVFELAHGSGTITTLASFDETDGEGPHAGLIMDSSGNLYGTAVGGSASGDGTVFELAHGSGTITTLASFNDTDGRDPFAALIMDSSGNLYGTAQMGGASSDGTIFELVCGSGTITTLASFNFYDGKWPEAALVMDSSGNLYGTTYLGGFIPGSQTGLGTVFKLASGSGQITRLASFNGTDGEYPEGALVMDSSGDLYGTTHGGGALGDGTIFELTGAATAAVPGIAASFVVSTGQPMGAAGVLAGTERPDRGFEPVEVAAQDMAGKKATILTTEQVKSPAGGEELVPALGDIDLFSLMKPFDRSISQFQPLINRRNHR